jgi:hypothetical protein
MSPVYLGFIDLVVLDKRKGFLEVSIHDHKFLSDKRYVPDETSAKKDYQTIIYAKAIISYFPVNTITFSYDYYGTKYKWTKNVKITLTREEIDAIWLSVLSDTESTLDNYSLPSGDKTTPNYLSCQMFGGCEFKTICFGESTK